MAGFDAGSLYYSVDAQTGNLLQAQRDVDRASKRMERSFEGVDHRVTEMAAGVKRAFASIATVAVVGATFKRVIRDTADFEQAMLNLQAVSGATADEMERLEKQAREMGATTQFSAQQAAEGQRFLAQAGFNANQIISATPGILKLATAGSLDLARAADIASNVLGQFQLPVSDLARVNDVLAKAASSSNTNIGQLAEALSQAGPIANSAGLSIEETAAAIGTLSNAGIQGGRAGTGLLGVIRQLSNVTPQAEKVLNKYGLSVQDVNVETNGLQTVLNRLRQANMSTADSFAVFQSEAGPAAQILSKNSQQVEELTGNLDKAAGSADEMADIIGSGLAGSIRTFNSALGETILQLGEGGVGGSFEYLIDTASGVLSAFNGMLDKFVEANDIGKEQVAVISGVSDGLKLMAALLAGRVAGSLGTAAAAMAAKTAASVRDVQATKAAELAEAGRQATLARTAAAEKTAEANSASLAARRAMSARLEASAEASRLAAVKASLVAERALETQRLKAQISETGRRQSLARLAEIRTSEAAITNQQTAATARLTAAQQEEASATRLASAATVQQTAASRAATAAMTQQAVAMRATGVAATAMASATRAAATAMGLLGGPVGVAILAAVAIYQFRDELSQTRQPAVEATKAVDGLTTAINKNSRASIENGIAALTANLVELESKAIKARQSIKEINERNNTPGPFQNSTVMGAGAEERKAEYDKLQRIQDETDATKAKINELRGVMDSLGNQDDEKPVSSVQSGGVDASSSTAPSTSGVDQLDKVKKQLATERETIEQEYQARNEIIRRETERGSSEQMNLLQRSQAMREQQLKAHNQRVAEEEERSRTTLYEAAETGRVARIQSEQEEYALRLQNLYGFTEQAAARLAEFRSNAADPLGTIVTDMKNSFSQLDDTIASTFTQGIRQGQSFGEIMQNIGRSILADLLQSFVKLGVQMAVNAAIGNAGASAAAATAAATGSAMAASYAPAAAMASLASFGGNAIPAAAALSGTTALASGLAIAGGRQYGGSVSAGSMYRVTEDSKPEMYSDGTQSYLLPGRNGKVTSNNDMMAGGGQTVVQNTIQLIGQGAENATVKQSKDDLGNQMTQIFLNDLQNGGKMSRGITSTFNTSRKGQ